MKRVLILIASALLVSMSAYAGERAISFDRLPVQARTFINNHYLVSEVTHVIMDESLIRPEYKVYLAHGVDVEFDYNGALEKISSKEVQIPEDIIPVQIREYVKLHYPGAVFNEYEVDKRHYEVTLSNRVELNFNRKFHLVEVDY
ncbi:MAG: hypothetical protein E7112_09675 [Bacteroidales bacterium]|nr:hypothetical protein [Bacteroidales bacterium]